MKKRIVLLPVMCAFLSLSACGSKANFTIPEFKETDGINIVAYAGPTVISWGGAVNTLTDEHYKEVADAGFNTVLALYEGNGSTGKTAEETLTNRYITAERDAMKALPLAEKYGMKYYVRDWNLYGMSRKSETSYAQGINCLEQYRYAMKLMFPDTCQYVQHPAYGGSFTFDEPSYEEIDAIGDVVTAYYERMAELNVPEENRFSLVNLLPAHAGSSALGSHTYSEYVDQYIKRVACKTGSISYDFYPLMADGKEGAYVKSLYLNNLQVCADKAKENNLELHTFLQSKGDFTGMRDMVSTADIRFQMYTNMAFGATDITYYEYGGKNNENEGRFSLFDLTHGTLNWTYNCAKTVNNEVHQFEDAYLAYAYDNVMYKSKDETYENQNFLNLNHHLEKHDNVKIVSTTEDTLLTTFKHKENGSDAFMLVNFSDPYYDTHDTVTLKFPYAKGLLMYRMGQKVIAALPDSKEYTFKLTPGEGRFIIPLV